MATLLTLTCQFTNQQPTSSGRQLEDKAQGSGTCEVSGDGRGANEESNLDVLVLLLIIAVEVLCSCILSAPIRGKLNVFNLFDRVDKQYIFLLSATVEIVPDPNLHCLVQIVVKDKVVETS